MYNIIAVDDEQLIREGLKCIDWESLGLNFLGSYENGLLAYQRICEGDIDIVLMDINMPVMNGFELAQKINDIMPSIVIIVLSAYEDFSYAQKLIEYNVCGYLLKPIEMGELKRVVANTIKKCDAIKAHENELAKIKMNNLFIQSELKNSFLKRISYRQVSKPEFERECIKNNIRFNEKIFAGVIIPDNDLQTRSEEVCNLAEMVLERYFSENPIGYYAIHEFDIEFTLFLNVNTMDEAIKIAEEIKKELYKAECMMMSTFSCVIGGQCGYDGIYRTIENARAEIEKGSHVDYVGIYTEKETIDKKVGDSNYIVNNVKNYIHENFNKAITLKEISENVYVSRAHLCHIFREKTNMRIFEYLTLQRLEKAKELMKNPALNITQISEMVGYENARYFSTIFKREEGITPNEYRNKLKM